MNQMVRGHAARLVAARLLGALLLATAGALLPQVGGVPALAASDAGALQIVVLSGRADLLSGGDALVQVALPRHVSPSRVRVNLNGRDVTSSFALRPDGR